MNYRTITVAKWVFGTNPYACHISRRGRMHSKYHKNMTPASVQRIFCYIKANMVETCRSHENYIKYETAHRK